MRNRHKAATTAVFITWLIFSCKATWATDQLKPEVDSMRVTAHIIDMDCGLNCIELQVDNSSQSQVIVLDGSKAQCDTQHALLAQQIFLTINKAELRKNRRKKTLASIATGGLGCMLIGEYVENKEGKLAWLGEETKDRETRCRIFERRVIGPGDKTSGRLYFKGELPDTATLKIPAMFVNQYGESNQVLTVRLSSTRIDPHQVDSTTTLH